MVYPYKGDPHKRKLESSELGNIAFLMYKALALGKNRFHLLI